MVSVKQEQLSCFKAGIQRSVYTSGTNNISSSKDLRRRITLPIYFLIAFSFFDNDYFIPMFTRSRPVCRFSRGTLNGELIRCGKSKAELFLPGRTSRNERSIYKIKEKGLCFLHVINEIKSLTGPEKIS
jgi:hypothetical protein